MLFFVLGCTHMYALHHMFHLMKIYTYIVYEPGEKGSLNVSVSMHFAIRFRGDFFNAPGAGGSARIQNTKL